MVHCCTQKPTGDKQVAMLQQEKLGMEKRLLSIPASSQLHEGTGGLRKPEGRGATGHLSLLPDFFLGKCHSPAPAQGLCCITSDSTDREVGGRQARRKLLLPNFVSFN